MADGNSGPRKAYGTDLSDVAGCHPTPLTLLEVWEGQKRGRVSLFLSIGQSMRPDPFLPLSSPPDPFLHPPFLHPRLSHSQPFSGFRRRTLTPFFSPFFIPPPPRSTTEPVQTPSAPPRNTP